MFRRWLIRSLALTLLTLCVVAWVGSYVYDIELAWGTCDVSGWRCEGGVESAGGRCILDATWGEYGGGVIGWHFSQQRHEDFTVGGGITDYHFAGFRLQYSTIVYSWYSVELPFWFLTLVPVGIFWFAWRKTRAKPVGGAFPVEVTTAKGESKA